MRDFSTSFLFPFFWVGLLMVETMIVLGGT